MLRRPHRDPRLPSTPGGASWNRPTISATLGTTTGQATLTVTEATLASISVTPTMPSRPVTTVASIANIGSPGLATGLSTGTTTIRAVQDNVTGSTTLTITDAVLLSIAVTPATVTIPRTSTQQFTARGTFSDTSVVDITTQVTWTSSDPSVVAISNASLSQGLATALAHGMVSVSADKGAVSGMAGATVP